MKDGTIERNYKTWLRKYSQEDPDIIVWLVENFNIVSDRKDVLCCLQPCTQNGRHDVTKWLIDYFDIPLIDQIPQ